MTLLLDPKDPVEKVIRDHPFRIRVFMSREMARFMAHVMPLQDKLNSEAGDVEISGELLGHMEYAVQKGVMPLDGSDGYLSDADLDRIPFEVWPELYAAILEVNSVTEEDRKN